MINPTYDALLKERSQNKAPNSGLIELNWRCNISCKHCYLSSNRYKKIEELTLAEIDSLARDLFDLGAMFISLSGGEIFLRKDIFEILDIFKKYHFAVKLFTNGLLITDEIIKRLSNYPIFTIEIPIYDYYAKSHDTFVNKKGAFDKATSIIRKLSAAGFRVILKTIITNFNYKHYFKIKQIAIDAGADFRYSNSITRTILAEEFPLDFKLNREQYMEFMTIIQQRDFKPKRTNDHPDRLNASLCGAGNVTFAVSAVGKVYPCIVWPMECGDIRQNSFKDIWNNSKCLKMVRNLKQKDLKGCSECSLYATCNPCPGTNYYESGDFLTPSKNFCDQVEIEALALDLKIPVNSTNP